MIRPIGGICFVGALAVVFASFRATPEPISARDAKLPVAAAAKTFARTDNLSACVSCHANGFAAVGGFEDAKSYNLVTLAESKRWAEKDLHSTAWRVLISPLGNRMTELLGYDVSKAAACLTCHGVDATPSKSLASKKVEDFVPPPKKGAAVKPLVQSLKAGVSCEGCHGNAAEWYEPHISPDWRSKDPASYKQAEMGLVDLRNPETRAAKCASCHIGNVSEGKLVTHEMYAAGHPPLPAFELATFSRDEPGHYMPPSRNPHFASLIETTNNKDGVADRDLGLAEAWRLFHFDPEEIQSARYAAVGSVVNLREYLRTLSTEAATATEEKSSLDWTHFNCSACHHDLKYPSQRQKTGYLGKPGRLFPRMWSVTATRAVLEHASTIAENRIGAANVPVLKGLTSEFEGLVEALLVAFDKQQYGSPADVRLAADRLENWCGRFVAVLDRPGLYNRKSAESYASILQTWSEAEKQKIRSRSPFNDYDTAQHLFWGWSTVNGELSIADGERKDLARMTNIKGEANVARMNPLEWATLPPKVEKFQEMLDVRARWAGDSSFLRMPFINLENTDETKEMFAPRSIQELSIERSKRRASFESLKFVTAFQDLAKP